jgi:hypothetical protein
VREIGGNFEGGVSRETEKDTKIEGTNSRIYCKQRGYRFLEAKNELVFECKKPQISTKNSATTAKKQRSECKTREPDGTPQGYFATSSRATKNLHARCGTGILPVRTARMAVPHFGCGNATLSQPRCFPALKLRIRV